MYSLVVSVCLSLSSLLLLFVSLSEESLLSWKKVLRVVDLCPEIIIVSLCKRLVFWLGLLYLSLPLDRPEPMPDEVGEDVVVAVALAD